MPANAELAQKIWMRYSWCRDNGHTRFMEKQTKCERFFAGDQWEQSDRAKLEAVRRPVLTINKIMSTIGNVLGDQINNRAETSFRPRNGANPQTADALNQVFKQISDQNQLAWKRSEMFQDGVIGSRGYLDVRMGYSDGMQGDVIIENLNPKNVIVDPDADEYDPDSWSDVFITKWVTADDIAILYGKADADLLRNKDGSTMPYGFDAISFNRDRFGTAQFPSYESGMDNSNVQRNIRIVDRQYRQLDRQKFFLSPQTGDMRQIPKEFDRDRIAMFVQQYGFQVVPKLVRRIKWTVIADNVVLHDEWSPYKHFTVVPYFPHFRRGHTIGLVENLLDPQELLNKVTSQELHVVNTTANSGYKVRAGALTNMTVEELEEKGAQTGLVIEVNGDPDKDVVKISPNQVPQGLDRISYKAEESIKTISGISDSLQGMDRADVSGKAIQAKQKAGSTNLVKPLDNLTRTDYILARNILDLVQEFYTEPRLVTICHDQTTGATSTTQVNQPNPQQETGQEPQEDPYQEILNDLTLGEYDVVVTSVPVKDTLEDSQFEQLQAMKELGIQIPDSAFINASRLANKKDIIAQMQQAAQSPQAQAQAKAQQDQLEADVAKTKADAAQKNADVPLRQAKTQETQAKAQVLMQGEPDDGSGQAKMAEVAQKGQVAQHKMGMDQQAHQQDMSIKERELALKEKDQAQNVALKEQDMEQKRQDAAVAKAQQAAAAAAKPTSKPSK